MITFKKIYAILNNIFVLYIFKDMFVVYETFRIHFKIYHPGRNILELYNILVEI